MLQHTDHCSPDGGSPDRDSLYGVPIGGGTVTHSACVAWTEKERRGGRWMEFCSPDEVLPDGIPTALAAAASLGREGHTKG